MILLLSFIFQQFLSNQTGNWRTLGKDRPLIEQKMRPRGGGTGRPRSSEIEPWRAAPEREI